jgi:hypothetical protein
MTPRISICVPNLNALPFLQERFDTIFGQTLQDWELFVFDSYSDDGSWEFIQRLAKREKRMRIVQGARKGPYAAWNECVRQTNGESIYIATSDDTMAKDFLEKMVSALELHEHCELAHSPLIMIGESGERLADHSWPECTVFGLGIGELVEKPHVRRAPYDGLLHLTGQHAYLSITQLLIRRSLFSRIGEFPDRWGPVSDFNWEMKAGLVANTVHVPDTWATWRVHSRQASTSIDVYSVEHSQKFEEMIRNAVSDCETYLPPAVVATLNSHLLETTRELRTYYAGLRQRHQSAIGRRIFQASQLFTGTTKVRWEIIGRLFSRTKWPANLLTEIPFLIEPAGGSH